MGIHGKYLTVSGGPDDQHLVWMGSHNLTDNALLRNDETFLLIDDQVCTTPSWRTSRRSGRTPACAGLRESALERHLAQTAAGDTGGPPGVPRRALLRESGDP